jgi:tRNA-2-methylthio-N6-dimethylallyladenosine synthase
MNIAESASVEQLFIARGWKKADDVQIADMVIINTCSVRGSAEERIFGRLGFFSALKKVRSASPDAKKRNLETAAAYVEKNGATPLTLVVMGCMAERLLDSLQKDWQCIDYTVGTFSKNRFGEIIRAVEENQKFILPPEKPVYVFAETSLEPGAFSSFVPIMHGCNNFCSYCIVPYVRGRETSRPVSEIFRELEMLGKCGVKEITLLGQNVNSYFSDGTNFPLLLKKISAFLDEKNSSIKWIRFESSNPKDFSDELIDTISAEKKICRGLHIAVQHGSDEILKRMNRKYSRAEYLELVKKLKSKIPSLQLSTDLMLGFPGETDDDFQQVISLMKEVRYESAFMYYFNPREGTPACRMQNQIPLDVKKIRLQKVIDLQQEITKDVMKKRIGEKIQVLCDIVSRDDSTELLGKTEQNERIAFTAPKDLIGKFATVKIDSLNGNTFRGTLVTS